MRAHDTSTNTTRRVTGQRPASTLSRRGDDVELADEQDMEEEDERLYLVRSRTSARRYRPIESDDDNEGEGESVGYLTQAISTTRSRQVMQRDDEGGEQQVNVFVRRRSRLTPHVPPRALPPARTSSRDPHHASRATEPVRQRSASAPIPSRPHWLWWVGIGMLVTLGLWMAGSTLLSWWQLHQDDATYGRPRTFQCDWVVGHNDSPTHPSHFIALNLHRQVEIIEFPGGDGSHARVYLGPTLLGDGEDLTPVTLAFRDVTGDGKPDMLVSIARQTTAVVFINDNGAFRPQRPSDTIHL